MQVEEYPLACSLLVFYWSKLIVFAKLMKSLGFIFKANKHVCSLLKSENEAWEGYCFLLLDHNASIELCIKK